MKPKKSRKYTIDGEKYVFNFNASGNLEGITSPKGRNGQLRQNPIDPIHLYLKHYQHLKTQ